MKIIAYLNPACPRSMDLRAIMNKYNLEYDEHEIAESLTPQDALSQKYAHKPSACIHIDGTTLNNLSGEDFEKYLIAKGLVKPTDEKSTSSKPADEEREGIRSKTIRFF